LVVTGSDEVIIRLINSKCLPVPICMPNPRKITGKTVNKVLMKVCRTTK